MDAITRLCEACGDAFVTRHPLYRFCSKPCQRRAYYPKSLVEATCLFCGEKHKREHRQPRSGKTFCSRGCARRYFEEAKQASFSSKVCARCKETKSLSEFRPRSGRAHGYNPRCKDCERVIGREYYLRNREHVLQTKQLWRESNRAKCAEFARRSRAKDPTAYIRWRIAHPQRYRLQDRASQQKRWARKKANGYESVDYTAILARDGYCCHICGGAVSPSELEFDHVIPLARGGPHKASNIKVAHGRCNLRKGTHLMEELGLQSPR